MLSAVIMSLRRRWHLARANHLVNLAEREQEHIAAARLREQQYRALAKVALRRARGYLA